MRGAVQTALDGEGECLFCPDNAECPGGPVVAPQPGAHPAVSLFMMP
jgi:hypothetical protein